MVSVHRKTMQIAAEVASCSDSAVRSRMRNARFPELKTLDQFDMAAAPARPTS